MHEIQLRDAKATLSTVVDEAINGQPSVITRHGRKAAVVISWKEWERLSQVPSFGHLLASLPVGPEDLPDRDQSPLREVDV
jgi:antitoxin Phd